MMKKISQLFLYILTVSMAFGTINPFAISAQLDPDAVSEPIFVSLFSLCFVVTSWIAYPHNDGDVLFKRMATPLLIMVATFGIADVIYDITGVNWYFVFKLAFAVIAYYTLARHFARYPKDIEICLLIFAITSTLIILASYTYFSSILTFSKGRMSIFGENANSTSSRMSMAIFALMYFFNKRDLKLFYKLVILGAVLLLLVYIIMSGSRGSFVFTLAGIALFVIMSGTGRGKKILAAGIGVLALVFIVSHYVDMEEVSMFERLSTIEESGNSREKLMEYAVKIYSDNPIIGVGSNGYLVERIVRGYDDRDSHNIITTIMAMGGTVGLICFIHFLFLNFKVLFRKLQQKLLPLVMFLSMLFISLKTGGVITFMLMWYIYAIVYGMTRPQFISLGNYLTKRFRI